MDGIKDNLEVYPPPTHCDRCGSSLLETAVFGRGKEWEVSCFMCGRMWWPRRRKLLKAFQKYRYNHEEES